MQATNKMITSHSNNRLRGSCATEGPRGSLTSARPQNLQKRESGVLSSPQAKHATLSRGGSCTPASLSEDFHLYVGDAATQREQRLERGFA